MSRPLVVAANRLPVMRSGDGWEPSPGGLVRALYPLLRESGGTWVGWTGESDGPTDSFVVDGVVLHPIALSASEVELYYEGFANDALWPLYHDALRDSTYDVAQWDSYRAVNQRVAVTLANVAPPNAVVWIHDYHLQLVPAMLREQRSDVTIGFFLHIPFPPFELFARLPWRDDVLRGLLGADLVGFQRPMGASNFAFCVERMLGLDVADDVVVLDGRRATIGVFPISIDVAEVEETAGARTTGQAAARIRTRLGDPEVVLLGVDRLDYTKGIGLRLRAFGALLDAGRLDPERHVMIQVATPTRELVEHYQDERHHVEQLVGAINGRFSRIGFPVVHYLYRSLPYDELIGLYRAGDVMLVTPVRDGMNLVAKEFVAAKIDGDGVLVLSEFAGAADELTAAVLVNPHDDQALQDAIVEAIEMHRHERRSRMASMRSQVVRRDVRAWAKMFLAAVDDVAVQWDDPDEVAAEIAAMAPRLLLALDVDGVLAPIAEHAADAHLVEGTAAVLDQLAAAARVVIVSGRSLADLETRFSFPSSVSVSGSHGAEKRGVATAPLDHDERKRLATLRALAEAGAARAGDGAWVESKPASVVLHVRMVAGTAGREALDWLGREAAAVPGATTKHGHEVIELFSRRASKADVIARERGADGVCFIGDDATDEEAMRTLVAGDVGVRVGLGATAAHRRVRDTTAVHRLLVRLVEALQSRT